MAVHQVDFLVIELKFVGLVYVVENRHAAFTDYDELLTQDYDQDSARFFVAAEIEAMLNAWGVRRPLTSGD